MIIEWLLDLFSGFIDWVLSLVTFDVPDWLEGLAGTVAGVINAGAGLGAWVPWPLVLLVVGGTFTIWGAGLFIKAARWLLGLIPTMGGG